MKEKLPFYIIPLTLRMSASPAPEQSGQSTPAANDTGKSQSQTPAPTPAAKPTPSPLDSLSPAELRKKLEEGRSILRTQLEKKRKLDRDLVSRPTASRVVYPSRLTRLFAFSRPSWRLQSTHSKARTSPTRSFLPLRLRTQLRPPRLSSETSFAVTIPTSRLLRLVQVTGTSE